MVQNLDRTQQTTTDTHRKWPLGAAGPCPSLVCCLLRGLLLFAAVLRVMLRAGSESSLPRSSLAHENGSPEPQERVFCCRFRFSFSFFYAGGSGYGGGCLRWAATTSNNMGNGNAGPMDGHVQGSTHAEQPVISYISYSPKLVAKPFPL